jgi:hypothetical protein
VDVPGPIARFPIVAVTDDVNAGFRLLAYDLTDGFPQAL